MSDDFVTEAVALSDYLECFEDDNACLSRERIDMSTFKLRRSLNQNRYRVPHTNNMKVYNNYTANKSAKVGDEIVCPICRKRFIKKSYQQAFCCTHCKDEYHNRRLHYR